MSNKPRLILSKALLGWFKFKNLGEEHDVGQEEGEVRLPTRNPRHTKAIEIARQSFRKYADTYKALAK
jgi:hypothetical protein